MMNLYHQLHYLDQNDHMVVKMVNIHYLHPVNTVAVMMVNKMATKENI